MNYPIELGIDLVTLLVAIFAFLNWFIYDKRRRKNLEEREVEQQQHTNEDRLKSDRAEIAQLHEELTTTEVANVLSGELSPADIHFLTGLHQRIVVRYDSFYDDANDGRNEEPVDAGINAMLALVKAQLDDLRDRLPRADGAEEGSVQPAKPTRTRDFSKYFWNDTTPKEGKYALIALIGAKFAKDHKARTKAEFEDSFSKELALALGIDESAIDKSLLLDEMNHARQRERYAQTDRKWKADRGEEGTMTFDGKDYRTAWALGVKGGQPADRQLQLIEYFTKTKKYPIRKA